MHVLILSQYFPPEIGASQARLEFYARYFKQAGHRVTVITTFPNYPRGEIRAGYTNAWFKRELFEGIEVTRTWLWEDASRSGRARLKWFISFMVSSFVAGMRVDRPDVILVENPPLFSGLTANLLGLLRRAPVINHMADMWVDAAIDFGFVKGRFTTAVARALESFVLRHCRGIVAVTEKVHAHALRFQPKEHVRLVPNGVDTSLYVKRPVSTELRERHGLAGKFVIVYAGTMGFQHDLDVIVEAAALLQSVDGSVRFLMIGEGSERERTEALATSRGLRNMVFVGAQRQEVLVDYLSSSDLGVSTLKKADFTVGVRPVKMYSYMACELPIIASDIGESAALLVQAQCGTTVPPGDPKALAAAIVRLRATAVPDLVAMGARGRAFAETHFSRATMAALLIEFLESFLAPKH